MQRAGKFGMLANSCKDLDRSGSKRYEKLCAWSCFQRVGDLLVLQLVFPGGVNQFFFLCFGNFAIFPPFHLEYYFNFVLQLGRVSPTCQRC